MKLISTIVSLFTITLILPLALATSLTHNTNEVVRQPGGKAAAEHVPTTNAERFARGLPPLSPSKSRKRGSPTRRDSTSAIPMVTYRGYIEVSQGDSSIGHIGTTGPGGIYYGPTTDLNNKLIVSFALPVNQNSGFGLNILTENSQAPGASTAPYLGFASGSEEIYYAFDFAVLTCTDETLPSASGPSTGNLNNGPSLSYMESSVWSVDISTGEMSAAWTSLGSCGYCGRKESICWVKLLHILP